MSLIRLAKTGLFIKLSVNEEYTEIAREIKLHRAVLDKAIIDSFSIVPSIKQDVDDWLDLDNPIFIEACERAFLEPELVYATFKSVKRILQGDKAKFKKFGKRN